MVRDRTRQLIWLYQNTYIKKICAQFDININGKYFKILLPLNKLLPNQGNVDIAFKTKYKKIIGLINYVLIVTRPDILQIILKLAKFIINLASKYL